MKKKYFWATILGGSALVLSGCGGNSDNTNGNGLDTIDTPKIKPLVVGQVVQALPQTTVANLAVQFEAVITNNGGGSTSSTNIIEISDVSINTTIPEGVNMVIDTANGVGANAECFDPIENEGATLQVGESCYLRMTFTNTQNQFHALNGEVVVALVGARSSAIQYPINLNLLAGSKTLLQTGQNATVPLNPAPIGSDGDIQAGVAWSLTDRFDASNADVIVDRLTDLMWQKNPSINKNPNDISSVTMTWDEAVQACDTLSQGGYDDWRLPNVLELMSLIDYASQTPAATLNDYGFEGVLESEYFSSTLDDASVFEVNFKYGYVSADIPKTFQFPVLCTRGATNLSAAPIRQTGEDSQGVDYGISWDAKTRFQITDEIFVDTITGLIWQNDPSINNAVNSWSEALEACNSLDYAGYQDWRLPNVIELYSLMDFSFESNDIHNASQQQLYYSSSYMQSSDLPWVVDFEYFEVNIDRNANVWCVRGGII